MSFRILILVKKSSFLSNFYSFKIIHITSINMYFNYFIAFSKFYLSLFDFNRQYIRIKSKYIKYR